MPLFRVDGLFFWEEEDDDPEYDFCEVEAADADEAMRLADNEMCFDEIIGVVEIVDD